MPEELASTIKAVASAAFRPLQESGAIALYLGGSALTDDFLPWSDIDLYAIVTGGFDFSQEGCLTQELSRDCRPIMSLTVSFHVIALSELQGGPQKGITTERVPLGILIRRLPSFRHLSGQQIDFSALPVQPFTLKGECRWMVARIRRDISWIREGQFIPSELPKQVMHLARIEAEAERGLSYTPSFVAVSSHFSDSPDHIVHSAMSLRKQEHLRREIAIEFSGAVETYLEDIESRVVRWP